MMSKIFDQVQAYCANHRGRILFVHADVSFGFEVAYSTRQKFFLDHLDLLEKLNPKAAIWMPCFNYNFPKEDFSVKDTVSQVGALTEFFRLNRAAWRTAVPMFSIAGIGPMPRCNTTGTINPFDGSSAFQKLVDEDGIIMFYGASFATATAVHYFECLCEVPYRYYKIFKGFVIDQNGQRRGVEMRYLVRPKNFPSGYAWDRMEADLLANGVMEKLEQDKTRVLLIKTSRLKDFWVSKLKVDPFYFLDRAAADAAKTKIKELGRGFQLTDFE